MNNAKLLRAVSALANAISAAAWPMENQKERSRTFEHLREFGILVLELQSELEQSRDKQPQLQQTPCYAGRQADPLALLEWELKEVYEAAECARTPHARNKEYAKAERIKSAIQLIRELHQKASGA